MTTSTNDKVGKRLKKQYLLYVAFFPFCEYEKQDKLLHQMVVLREQIRKISTMKPEDKNATTYIHFEEKESELNKEYDYLNG